MTKLTAKQKDQMITDMAYQVKKFLEDSGAVRKADNVDPSWFSKEEICDRCEIPLSMWKIVKERAWEEGIPLTHGYFTGYYIGSKGEQTRCIVQHYTTVRGLAKSASRAFMLIGRSGQLEDGLKLVKDTIGISLQGMPNLMKALDMPLPPEAEQLLLGSGEEPESD